ncbi:MAG: cupin domain-containing protein [Gammaproteobacteria bacterium]|nr:cupin domain-containing protein [Gammaproteobacteria bacterium]
MKRVVTGHNEQGRSVFVEVGEPDHTVRTPGMVWREIWATYKDTAVPLASDYKASMKSRWQSVFPAAGETRIRIVEFDPEALENSWSAETEQVLNAELPGLLEHMEVDDSAMHTTNSVDYGILLKGRLTLELDDGEKVELEAGDVVIQNGTRHAWRYTEKCTIAWILIGVPSEE